MTRFDKNKLPKHIGFIMDGNGRWANKRGRARTYGHKVGIDTVTTVIKHCQDIGVKYITFYAFSTENWKRPKDEVDEIFRLLEVYIRNHKQEFIERKIKLNILGQLIKLPQKLQKELTECIEKTKNFSDFVVNIAIDYGSRTEIVNAVNQIINDKVQKVDEKTFSQYLQTADMPDPDLIVRTSGEYRLSNFLLYQGAYSEFYFPKVYWPSFREKEIDRAIKVYLKRRRRFGAI